MRAAIIAGFMCLSFAAMASHSRAPDWTPPGPVMLMIGFMEDEKADIQTRRVAAAIEERLGWTIEPVQITDELGGQNLTHALRYSPANGTVIGAMRSETLGYNMIAVEGADYSLADFTPLSTVARFQMGITAMFGRGLYSWDDVIAAASGDRPLRFGAMSPRLADIAHILGDTHGVEFDVVMLRGEQAVMDGLASGDLDLGWTAGIQTEAVERDRMVVLASGLSDRLAMAPDAPTVLELGSPYDADGYILFTAPGAMPKEARDALSEAIAYAMADTTTEAHAVAHEAFGGPEVMRARKLRRYLERSERQALGLVEAASDMENIKDDVAVGE